MRRLKAKDLDDYEVNCLDFQDYPDYSDAYICWATSGGTELTDNELDYLHHFDPGGVHDAILKYVEVEEHLDTY